MDFQEKQLSSLQMQHLHVKDIKFSATGKEPVRPTKMNVALWIKMSNLTVKWQWN